MIQIQLHKGQREVYDDKTRFRVVVAGRRWGKTVLSQIVTLDWATRYVGVYWIVSPTYKQAKMIHWRHLTSLVPREWVLKKNEVELSITLRNGSLIELKGAENPDALRGVKLRGLVIDEIASIRNWEWLWSEVLRPTLTDYAAPSLFISTPKGYNHFHELYLKGQSNNEHENTSEYKSWRFTSYDNPYISKGEIDHAKQELTEDTFYQEYMADFRKYTGLVYKEFNRQVHVIEPFEFPDSWTLFRGIDFGSTNPTACLWIAVDSDENWYIMDEHYETQQTIDYHAGLINSKSVGRNIQASYGDPSGAQWISEFAQRGIYITPANKEVGTNFNSWVRFGIEKVGERLKSIPGHTVPILSQGNVSEFSGRRLEGMPSLFIFSGCVNVIREFETYRWKEKSVTQAQDLNEPDVPEKANDHCFVKDTLILTKSGEMVGWKPIQHIEKGEFVWSPFGWNEVYRAGSTGIKKIKDYGIFKCTPDHKILTGRGLVEVDKLRYSDRIMAWGNVRQWSLTECLIGAIQMPKTELIGFIFNALLIKSLIARRDFYIETYGNTIMVQFLMGIWYIILTATLSIMTLSILSWSLLANTLNAINGVFGKGAKSTYRKSVFLLRLGTLLKRVGLVTPEMPNRHGQYINILPKRVQFAIRAIVAPSLIEASIAVKTVKQPPYEEEEVYNLATKFGMYFANGILVSNSMDALRYFAVSYKKKEPDYIVPENDVTNRNWSLI